MIPFGDLKRQYQTIKDEIDKAVFEVLESGWFVLGENLKNFEKDFADYCEASHAVGVGSGTEALHLALVALDLKEGDEVITVANTAIPTICAIVFAGGIPVFVDIDEKTFNMDAGRVEFLINKKTKAILPVHLFGSPVDLDPLLDLAKKYDLRIVEDACQAHGSEYKGKKAGTFGDIGCFSFYPSKNLGAFGDGGIAVTNNSELAERVFLLRNYGETTRYYHKTKGFNSRLDELQAAILRVKLKYLDEWNERRREIAGLYNSLLKDSDVEIPFDSQFSKSNYHLYVIKSDGRDELRKYLSERNLQTQIHYPLPAHLQEAYQYLNTPRGSLPITEKIASKILSLPIFPELTDEEVNQTANAVIEFSEKQ
ncbi:MAG: DegT/DnrJ/EryC1/StrS family aminotransferase [Actinobacteria bacterium]|nr:DegT/DnrJ/EryC1/StrS family aminotransferase [Actinomycetota bacterium]